MKQKKVVIPLIKILRRTRIINMVKVIVAKGKSISALYNSDLTRMHAITITMNNNMYPMRRTFTVLGIHVPASVRNSFGEISSILCKQHINLIKSASLPSLGVGFAFGNRKTQFRRRRALLLVNIRILDNSFLKKLSFLFCSTPKILSSFPSLSIAMLTISLQVGRM